MPVYPTDANDTVVYNGVDLYVPKDCSVTVFEDSRIFLFGEWYLNGAPIMTGQSAPSGLEVAVSTVQPVDPGIKLWFDTSAGYGELKVIQAGSWKTVEDPQDIINSDEVSIGIGQPVGTNYELWVDTSVTPENLKAKVGGSWKSINSEVAIGGTEPTDPSIELWVDTATSPPSIEQSYISAGNALGIVAIGSFNTAVTTINANASAQVTNNLSVTLLTGRRYRVHFSVRAANFSAQAAATLNLRDGTTALTDIYVPYVAPIVASAGYESFKYEWVLDGDGTTKSLNVSINVNQFGNLTLGIVGNSNYFYVEDVGPKFLPPLPVLDTNTFTAAGNALGIVAVGSFNGVTALPVSTDTQVTNNLTVILSTGRRYKIHIGIRAASLTVNGSVISINCKLRDGTTFVPDNSGFWVTLGASTGYYQEIIYDWLFDGDNTTKNFNVVINPQAASTLYSQNQSYFYVEDVGPNQYPPLPVPATPPAWTPVTAFLNGWVNHSNTAYAPLAYRKIGDEVTLRGVIMSGTSSSVFQLPVGFRPAKYEEFAGECATNVHCHLEVASNGYVGVIGYGTGGTNAFVSLSGIQFSTTA